MHFSVGTVFQSERELNIFNTVNSGMKTLIYEEQIWLDYK